MVDAFTHLKQRLEYSERHVVTISYNQKMIIDRINTKQSFYTMHDNIMMWIAVVGIVSM
jgi:hypothetical protein